MRGEHTNAPLRPHIRTRHDLDAQVILHLADDLDGVVRLKMVVLKQQSVTESNYTAFLSHRIGISFGLAFAYSV